MNRVTQSIACGILVVALVTVAAASSYRLAGTVSLGDERYLAMIEMPGGQQEIFHVGDEFEDGTITRITITEAWITTSDDELVLTLTGLKSRAGLEMPGGPVIGTMMLDDEQVDALMRISGGDEKELTGAFVEALDLPEDMSVEGVRAGYGEYKTLVDAYPSLKTALMKGQAPHVFFAPGSPIDEVYLVTKSKYSGDDDLAN